MGRVAVVLLALAGCSSCIKHIPPEEITPATWAYTYDAPSIYWRWREEVTACVRFAATHDSSFKIVREIPAPDSIVWRAVPVEREGGQFSWKWFKGVIGLTFVHPGADTVMVSGQGIFMRSLVKHEMMHIMVERPEEWVQYHGRPWGLCEWV